MARRYPLRQRKARQVWEPRDTATQQPDLRDTDWASDVDTARSSDDEPLSDDSLHQFVVSDNEPEPAGEPSEQETAPHSDDELTVEESETISLLSDTESDVSEMDVSEPEEPDPERPVHEVPSDEEGCSSRRSNRRTSLCNERGT